MKNILLILILIFSSVSLNATTPALTIVAPLAGANTTTFICKIKAGGIGAGEEKREASIVMIIESCSTSDKPDPNYYKDKKIKLGAMQSQYGAKIVQLALDGSVNIHMGVKNSSKTSDYLLLVWFAVNSGEKIKAIKEAEEEAKKAAEEAAATSPRPSSPSRPSSLENPAGRSGSGNAVHDEGKANCELGIDNEFYKKVGGTCLPSCGVALYNKSLTQKVTYTNKGVSTNYCATISLERRCNWSNWFFSTKCEKKLKTFDCNTCCEQFDKHTIKYYGKVCE